MKKYLKGNSTSISTKAYATLHNRFLDRISSNSKRYDFDQVNLDVQKGRKTRPIVIIWSHRYSDKFIAVSQTTVKKIEFQILKLRPRLRKVKKLLIEKERS